MKKLKKILVILASAIAVVCLAVGLAGCADEVEDVNGNTYKFSSASFTVTSDYEGEEVTDEVIDQEEAAYEEWMADATVSFEDGVITITGLNGEGSSEAYSYTQDGATITFCIDEAGTEFITFTVSGDSLIWETEGDVEGIIIKCTFTKSN